MTTDTGKGTRTILLNENTFVLALRKTFRDPNKKKTIDYTLRRLKQTGLVVNYTTKFNRYAIQVD